AGSPPGFYRKTKMGLRKEFQNLVVDGVNDAAGRGEQRQHVGDPATPVAGVRPGAFGEQQAHGIGASILRGQHERRAPILVFGFELGPGFQEGFHAIGVALSCRGQPIVGRHRRQGGERQEEQNRARHHRPNAAKSPAPYKGRWFPAALLREPPYSSAQRMMYSGRRCDLCSASQRYCPTMPNPKLVKAPKNRLASTIGAYPGTGMSPRSLATITMPLAKQAATKAMDPRYSNRRMGRSVKLKMLFRPWRSFLRVVQALLPSNRGARS